MHMQKLVLIRHGESIWNKQNVLPDGWKLIFLKMVTRRQKSRRGLEKEFYNSDVAYTSILKRAIKTSHIILEELDHLWIPVDKSWRMNERFYGSLQGLNKAGIVNKYGEEQVHKWRCEPK